MLLMCHTYDDKHHGILARSWAQVDRVFYGAKFQRHIRDEGDLRVVYAADIEVVQPSREIQIELAAKIHAAERDHVRHMLCYHVKDLPPPWPPGFARCTHYASLYSPEEAWGHECHADCKNCIGGVTIRRTRFLEIYARIAAGEDPLEIRRGYDSAWWSASGVLSRAPYADPGRTLYELRGGSGMSWGAAHTENGVVKLSPHEMRYLMCHYHVSAEREDVVARLQASVQEIAQAAEQAHALSVQRGERAAAQRDEERIAQVRAFLG